MQIRFKHIIIEGFQSIGHAELDLCDRGYTIINGINNCPDDNAEVNGTGKSSLMNAACFALVGETVQGVSKNLVNINTDTGLYVELDFDVDGVQYKIIRAKDHNKYGTTVKLFVGGEDKSGKGIRDTEKIISEYLPELTSGLIGSVIIIGQGMPQRFTSNTPSGRKEVLEKLSKSDYMIEDIKDRLSSRKTSLASQIRDKDLVISKLEGQLSLYQRQLDSSKEKQATLTPPDEEKIKALTAEIEDRDVIISTQKEQISTTRNNILALTEELGTIKDEQTTATNEVGAEYDVQIQKEKESYYELSLTIKNLKAEIKKLDSVRDVCPTCGQKLPDVHKVDTTEQKATVAQLEKELDGKNVTITDIQNRKNVAVSEVASKYVTLLNNNNAKLNDEKKKLAELEHDLRDKESSLSQLRLQQARLVSEQENYLSRVQEIADRIKQTEDDIGKTNSELMYNNIGRDELSNRLDAVNKMLTIATRDFRGFLLTNVISYINKRAKTYSLDVFGTDKVDLSLDGNNLNVTYNGKMYENLSGGEQKKVDIIVQLALRDMLCQFSSFSSNMLVLDETFEALDFLGCQKIIDVISKRLSDIESIFIITHRSNLSLPADSTITIIKDEHGVSHIA